jgi:hypothetical protein
LRRAGRRSKRVQADTDDRRGPPSSGFARGILQVFSGQDVGVRQVDDRIWLVTFMHYDLGYFDDETCRLEPIENPFATKVLPMCPE